MVSPKRVPLVFTLSTLLVVSIYRIQLILGLFKNPVKPFDYHPTVDSFPFILSLLLYDFPLLLLGFLLSWSISSLWMKGSSGTGANMYASLAMRRLVLDIQEGSSAQVVNGNLVVNFPYYSVATGQYIKGLSGVTATYYISGPTGSESSGTYLWKQVGTEKTRLARNVESMVVSVTANKLVRITITGRDQEGGAVSPNLLQQSVKLRNG